MSDFLGLAGVACILFAILFPLAYCTAHSGLPVTNNDIMLACVKGKGEWKAEGWGPYTCHWPKERAE